MRRDALRLDGTTVYAVDAQVTRRALPLGDPGLVRWRPDVVQPKPYVVAGHLIGEDGEVAGSLTLITARIVGFWADHIKEQEEMAEREARMNQAREDADERLRTWHERIVTRVGKRNQALPDWARRADVLSGRVTLQQLSMLVDSAYISGMQAARKDEK